MLQLFFCGAFWIEIKESWRPNFLPRASGFFVCCLFRCMQTHRHRCMPSISNVGVLAVCWVWYLCTINWLSARTCRKPHTKIETWFVRCRSLVCAWLCVETTFHVNLKLRLFCLEIASSKQKRRSLDEFAVKNGGVFGIKVVKNVPSALCARCGQSRTYAQLFAGKYCCLLYLRVPPAL